MQLSNVCTFFIEPLFLLRHRPGISKDFNFFSSSFFAVWCIESSEVSNIFFISSLQQKLTESILVEKILLLHARLDDGMSDDDLLSFFFFPFG